MNNKTKKTINYIFAAIGFICFTAFCLEIRSIQTATWSQIVFLSIPLISTSLHLYFATKNKLNQ